MIFNITVGTLKHGKGRLGIAFDEKVNAVNDFKSFDAGCSFEIVAFALAA